MSDSAPQFRTDGHALICDGQRFAVCDTPDAAVTLARICNCHAALVAALQTVSAHYSGSLDSQPPYLAAVRAVLAHTAQGDV